MLKGLRKIQFALALKILPDLLVHCTKNEVFS